MRPDFRNFIGGSTFVMGVDLANGKDFYSKSFVAHSAKGSEWEDHMYIKKIDGNYYYPDSYEGGRHLDEDQKDASEKRIASDSDFDDATIDQMARDVWRGLFGNGEDRKELLGDAYERVQSRVNEIVRSSGASSEKFSDMKDSKEKEKGEEAIKKAKSSTASMNMNTIYSVYEKKRSKSNMAKRAKMANKR